MFLHKSTSRVKKTIILCAGLFFWCISASLFFVYDHDITKWIGFLIAWALSFSLIFILFFSNPKKIDGAHDVLSNLLAFEEIILLEKNGTVVYTNGPVFQRLSHVLHHLSLVLQPNDAYESLMDALSRYQGIQKLLKGSEKKHYWIQGMSIDKNYYLIHKFDVTPFLKDYYKLLRDYDNAQKLIHELPFAILYLDANEHIIGTNVAAERLFHKSINDIVGQKKEVFIKREGSYGDMTLVSIGNHFGILVESKKNMNIVIALNKLPLQEDLFTKSIVASIVIQKDGTIVHQNEAFLTYIHNRVEKNVYSYLDVDNQKIFKASLLNQDKTTNILIAQKQTTCFVTFLSRDLFLCELFDISSQKCLEEQFIQSQKMQAVGELAGGVAHDFNNLLTAIIGFCDLLLQRVISNDPSYNDIVQIKQNANRASNLVRQLLAFSRRQTLQLKLIDVSDILSDLTTLLQRLIGASIDLNVVHGHDLGYIKADIGQFEQVIVNLAVNARDAMGGKGSITIRTQNITLKTEQEAIPEMVPSGEYVLIEIIDTGHGISPAHLKRIFEPFFSTKALGVGTGLGLSTVYGIVKQSGGYIRVKSQIGIGTTFMLYFKKLSKESNNIEVFSSDSKKETISWNLSGQGTILLVEDEDAIRLFICKALRDKGYTIVDFENAEDALAWAGKNTFDILITDVVMPKIDGPTLNNQLRKLHPKIKTLFISGYTEDAFKSQGSSSHMYFLQKPFALKDLAQKVKNISEST